MDSHFAKTRGIAGATILGDGRVACILDPVRILDQRSSAA
ncbi:MAG: chemotaxis protein CheW [Gemmatimonadales bacterium]